MTLARPPAPRPSWLVAVTVLCVCVPRTQNNADLSVQVTIGDMAAAVLVVVMTLLALRDGLRLPPRALLAFGPVVLALAVSTLNAHDIAASLPGFVRVAEIFVLVPLAVMLAVRTRADAAIVAGAAVAGGLFQAGVGIWQAVTRTGASISGHSVRAVGTFGAIDVMALATVVGYALVIVIAAMTGARGRSRALLAAATAVLALALVLALSRGAWIAVGAGVATVVVLFRRATAVRVAVCALAAAIVLGAGIGSRNELLGQRIASVGASITQPDQSVSDRFSLWSTAVHIWRDHPATGVGVKGFPAFRDANAPLALSSGSETQDPVNGYKRQPLLSPHNQYLLVLSEQGALGLFALLLLPGVLLHGLAVRRRTRDPLWLLSVGFLMTLLVGFLYGDLGGPTSVLTAVVLGLAAACALNPSAVRPPAAAPRLRILVPDPR
ncbi:O-antigen ligase family protein [Spirillospora sp. CA-294931]|uniref:O-antigen ligase family protein n=1 Tax=Spirillospora sp. CA-294931 TaxID=3240042 RepID=UPI003D940B01